MMLVLLLPHDAASYQSPQRDAKHPGPTLPWLKLEQAEPCNVFASPGTIAEYTRVAAEGTFDHDRSMYIGALLLRARGCVANVKLRGFVLVQRCITPSCGSGCRRRPAAATEHGV